MLIFIIKLTFVASSILYSVETFHLWNMLYYVIIISKCFFFVSENYQIKTFFLKFRLVFVYRQRVINRPSVSLRVSRFTFCFSNIGFNNTYIDQSCIYVIKIKRIEYTYFSEMEIKLISIVVFIVRCCCTTPRKLNS